MVLTAQEPASLFWCDAVMSLQFTYVHSFVCRLKRYETCEFS